MANRRANATVVLRGATHIFTRSNRVSEVPESTAAYDGLFAGSARLGVLCAGLGVPWESVVPFVGAFSERLKDYFELSIDPRAHALGVMTKGEGQAYVYRATRFMEEQGIAENVLKRFLVRAKYFEYRNCFFKIEADGQGLREFSTYFRRRPTLQVAHAILADSGVDSDGVGLMEAVAEVLGQRTVHFVGTAATLSGSLMEKVYFSQPEESTSWERIRAAGSLAGLSDSDWAPLAEHHGALAGKTTFVSVGYVDGVPQPGLKIDVHDVPPEVVSSMALSPDIAERADIARASSGRKNHSYVGFRMVPGHPVRLKTYTLA
jgi:hypothetical protein